MSLFVITLIIASLAVRLFYIAKAIQKKIFKNIIVEIVILAVVAVISYFVYQSVLA